MSVASPPSLPSRFLGAGWSRKGPCRIGLVLIVLGGCRRKDCEVEGNAAPDGSCFRSAVTYLFWYSYKLERLFVGSVLDWTRNSCLAWTKHSRAWIYDDGIELDWTVSVSRCMKLTYDLRVLRHVWTYRVNITASHESVYAERSPVRMSLA